MYKRFTVLLGIFLGCHAPVAAQTPAPQIILAPEPVAPAITMLPAVSPPLVTASFLLDQAPAKLPIHFSRLSFGVYEPDHSLTRLPGMELLRLCFSRSRAFRWSSSGAVACNWKRFRTRFAFRVYSLVL